MGGREREPFVIERQHVFLIPWWRIHYNWEPLQQHTLQVPNVNSLFLRRVCASWLSFLRHIVGFQVTLCLVTESLDLCLKLNNYFKLASQETCKNIYFFSTWHFKDVARLKTKAGNVNSEHNFASLPILCSNGWSCNHKPIFTDPSLRLNPPWH